MKEITPKDVLAVRCPTCGAAPGVRCQFGTGQPRIEPHRDRRLIAAERSGLQWIQYSKSLQPSKLTTRNVWRNYCFVSRQISRPAKPKRLARQDRSTCSAHCPSRPSGPSTRRKSRYCQGAKAEERATPAFRVSIRRDQSAVTMRFVARLASVKLAPLPSGGATCGTRDSEYPPAL